MLWPKMNPFYDLSTEPAFTCTKSAVETPDEYVKPVET